MEKNDQDPADAGRPSYGRQPHPSHQHIAEDHAAGELERGGEKRDQDAPGSAEMPHKAVSREAENVKRGDDTKIPCARIQCRSIRAVQKQIGKRAGKEKGQRQKQDEEQMQQAFSVTKRAIDPVPVPGAEVLRRMNGDRLGKAVRKGSQHAFNAACRRKGRNAGGSQRVYCALYQQFPIYRLLWCSADTSPSRSAGPRTSG